MEGGELRDKKEKRYDTACQNKGSSMQHLVNPEHVQAYPFSSEALPKMQCYRLNGCMIDFTAKLLLLILLYKTFAFILEHSPAHPLHPGACLGLDAFV